MSDSSGALLVLGHWAHAVGCHEPFEALALLLNRFHVLSYCLLRRPIYVGLWMVEYAANGCINVRRACLGPEASLKVSVLGLVTALQTE